MGSRRLASWLTSPCRDQSEATKRSDAVEILLGSMEKLENINEFLKSIPDFERTATRIALGSVKPRELAALRDALPSLNVIAENLSDLDSELLKETAEELPLPEELYQLLSKGGLGLDVVIGVDVCPVVIHEGAGEGNNAGALR